MAHFVFPAPNLSAYQASDQLATQADVLRRLRQEGFERPALLKRDALGNWLCAANVGDRSMNVTVDRDGTVLAVPSFTDAE